VASRSRLIAFGSAAALVVVGATCAALAPGFAADVVGVALVTLGLGAIVLLVFYEVGLSEDRELRREERRRRRTGDRRRPPPRRFPRRPG
jgi:NADH:ubiquinone oxidoreductase subunit 6 (subunit J)